MSDELDLDDETGEAGPGAGAIAVAVGLPALTASVAVAAGLVVGVFGTWLMMRGEPTIVEVTRDYSEAELMGVCEPLINKALVEAIDNLDKAEEKVTTLEGKVSTKQKEVQDLEDEMKRRAERGKVLVEERNALRAELAMRKEELGNLEKRLKIAVQEKELLAVELVETKADLEEQKYETHVAKEDALDYKWRDFIGHSQLEICDKGNRKKLGRCRETIEEYMGEAMQAKFDHCVRSGQAVPSVRVQNKSSDPLPQYSAFIDQDNRIVKDWYVMMCDPTLPEAPDGFRLPAKPAKPAKGDGDDLFGDLEDLDD